MPACQHYPTIYTVWLLDTGIMLDSGVLFDTIL
jgi:hypothetical protein